MKNTNFYTKTMAFGFILLLALFANIAAFGQNNKYDEKSFEPTKNEAVGEDEDDFYSRGIEGTWDTLVTLRNCQNGAAIRTFHSLGTFMFGGTMIDSTGGVPQSLKTPGQGVWKYLGRRTYGFSFKNYNFDGGGNFTGWQIIKHTATLNQKGSKYDSAGTAEFYDANGNLFMRGCSTTVATRFAPLLRSQSDDLNY